VIKVVTRSTTPPSGTLGAVQQDRRAEQHTSSTASCAASASDLPQKIATGSTPATRSVSSAPSSPSTANDRCTSTSRLNSVASQTRPGATRSSTFGVEREGEHHHRHPGERQHLVEQDAAATLDPQVLRGDEASDAPPAHGAASRDATRPPTTSTSTGGERPGALELVARDHHRGTGGRGLAQDVASSSSRPAASSPACGSSSSHSSARRATRQASAVRRF
jgi:hypothetical protein